MQLLSKSIDSFLSKLFLLSCTFHLYINRCAFFVFIEIKKNRIRNSRFLSFVNLRPLHLNKQEKTGIFIEFIALFLSVVHYLGQIDAVLRCQATCCIHSPHSSRKKINANYTKQAFDTFFVGLLFS